MAKAEIIFFQGKCKWAKVQNPDLEYRNWNIPVYLTPDSLAKFNKLKERTEDGVDGILNEIKMDEEGSWVVFKRPMFRNWGKGEEPMTPPEIIDNEGRPLPKDARIGNGSEVTVKCECYIYTKPFKKGAGRAIRLTGVKVDKLVPYSRDDMTPKQEQMIKGLEKQPPQASW